MNEIHSVKCPQCEDSFEAVNRAEEHIISDHCKFCGRKSPVTGSELKKVDVLDTPQYNGVVQKVVSRLFVGSSNPKIENVSGGFTPVLFQELIHNAENYVDSTGRMTDREALEYHELHKNRSSGKICEDCLEEYNEVVENQKEDE